MPGCRLSQSISNHWQTDLEVGYRTTMTTWTCGSGTICIFVERWSLFIILHSESGDIVGLDQDKAQTRPGRPGEGTPTVGPAVAPTGSWNGSSWLCMTDV